MPRYSLLQSLSELSRCLIDPSSAFWQNWFASVNLVIKLVYSLTCGYVTGIMKASLLMCFDSQD